MFSRVCCTNGTHTGAAGGCRRRSDKFSLTDLKIRRIAKREDSVNCLTFARRAQFLSAQPGAEPWRPPARIRKKRSNCFVGTENRCPGNRCPGNWRRRRDSNPRYALRAYNGLANRRLQPLGHVSVPDRIGRTEPPGNQDCRLSFRKYPNEAINAWSASRAPHAEPARFRPATSRRRFPDAVRSLPCSP